ncbi:hypothetical protein GOV12_06165 [Candidatus Pacearchaeota archaeon]|nr:hypothetical protein [Candidatus Pacearchaeota archaeon]
MVLEVITRDESIRALRLVREKFDVYMLKKELLEEGHDFEYLFNALNRGVEEELYSADERDEALQQNEDVLCMCAIEIVRKGTPYKLWKSILDIGVKSALFSIAEKNEAVMEGVQVQYRRLMDEARRNPSPPRSNIIALLPSYCVR